MEENCALECLIDLFAAKNDGLRRVVVRAFGTRLELACLQ